MAICPSRARQGEDNGSEHHTDRLSGRRRRDPSSWRQDRLRLAHNSKGRGNDADDVLWFGVDIWQPWDSHTGAKKGDLVTVIGDLSSREHNGKQYMSVDAKPWNAVSSVRRDKPVADSKPQGTGGW